MKKIKILILEDVSTDADLIIRTMERAGMDFDYLVISDSAGFIKAVNEQKFDAILADNSLPQFSAIEAVRIRNEKNINTPFILVTGSISEEYAVEIMKEGACDYILKDRLQRLPNAVLSAIHKYFIDDERKKYLDEVIANEALLKEAARLASFGSWEEDLENKVTRWSDEQYHIFGYLPGEIEPSLDTYLKFVHPDDRALVKQVVDYAIKHREAQKYSFRIIAKGGVLKHIHAKMGIKVDANGNVIRINGFTRDVSETVYATESLQKSEASMRAIFNNTETGYILLDTQFNIVSFNQLANKISIDLLGKKLIDGANALYYFKEQIRERFKKYLLSVLLGESITYEMKDLPGSDSGRWYNLNYHPVWNNEKKVMGIIIAITEITARKISELQEKEITGELMQRNQDLEQFAYIISHNLRSPVANIIGIADALIDGTLDDGDKRIFMDGLAVSIKKLDNIIIDLNDILQVKNVMISNKEKVSFSKLVDDIKFNIGSQLDQNGVMINTDFSEIDEVSTMKSYMHSIFYNLISNSIKYKQSDLVPEINIKSSKDADKIMLVFRDNSVGMDLETNNIDVFGLYKRFHPNLAEGKGMGLFMVKTQVEKLGGKISVQSEVNKGTEFKIEFDRKVFSN